MVQFSQWILVSNRKDLSQPWRDPATDHVMRSVSSQSGQNGANVSTGVMATDSRQENLLVCIHCHVRALYNTMLVVPVFVALTFQSKSSYDK